MEKNKYIFDLDGTLLSMDYSAEKMFFESIYGENAYLIVNRIGELLDKYENGFKKYDIELLSKYLTINTGLIFYPRIIESWINIVAYGKDLLEEGVIEVLDILKSKDKELVVLTNWFSDTQVPRLKNAGIYDYFDDVITGEFCLKPHREAYLKAIGDSSIDECLLIGDNYNKDYMAPRKMGLDAILYDRTDRYSQECVKIKKLKEIVKKY